MSFLQDIILLVFYAMGHSMPMSSMNDNKMPASFYWLLLNTLCSTQLYCKWLIHLLSPSLTHFNSLILYLCLAQTDTHIYRNLQRPICSITGRWVTIVITAAQSPQGSVCVLAVDTLWATECMLFRLDQWEWTMGQTCQGVCFVTGTRWVLNPSLCADYGSFRTVFLCV